jgi:tRNA(adenine34) deaminase
MVQKDPVYLAADDEAHVGFMQEALKEAKLAYEEDEVPVGAVIVVDGKIIARGHNTREKEGSPLAHAEINAIQNALFHFEGWRFLNASLYVTLEPCVMCAGAIISARIENVIYGTEDPKAGVCKSLYQLFSDERFNHRPNLNGPFLKDACSSILKEFFASKRVKKGNSEG